MTNSKKPQKPTNVNETQSHHRSKVEPRVERRSLIEKSKQETKMSKKITLSEYNEKLDLSEMQRALDKPVTYTEKNGQLKNNDTGEVFEVNFGDYLNQFMSVKSSELGERERELQLFLTQMGKFENGVFKLEPFKFIAKSGADALIRINGATVVEKESKKEDKK